MTQGQSLRPRAHTSEAGIPGPQGQHEKRHCVLSAGGPASSRNMDDHAAYFVLLWSVSKFYLHSSRYPFCTPGTQSLTAC